MTKIRLTHAFASNLCSLYYDRGFTPSLESTVPAAARRGRGPRKGALEEGSGGKMEEGKAPDQEDGMVEEAGEQEAQDDVGFGTAVRSRFLRLYVMRQSASIKNSCARGNIAIIGVVSRLTLCRLWGVQGTRQSRSTCSPTVTGL